MRLGLGHGLDVGYRPELFSNVPLLDTYSGAAAAYSLRKLRTGVTSVVRVRRSSDNAEANFTAAEVSDGTLTTWTGANDGFVVTWYDQSGNSGRDASQATAANQPQIVASGVITSFGAKNAPLFGSNDQLNASHSSIYPISIFGVVKFSNAAGVEVLFRDSATANNYQVSRNAGNIDLQIASGVSQSIAFNYLNKSLITGIKNGANSLLSVNGTSATFGTAGSTSSSSGTRIGDSAGFSFFGYCYEYIIYGSDKSADRAAIEAAINSHYSIY